MPWPTSIQTVGTVWTPPWPQTVDPMVDHQEAEAAPIVLLTRIAEGAPDAARTFLAAGHHPLGGWNVPRDFSEDVPSRTNAWTLALLAPVNPAVTNAWDGSPAWAVLRADMARRLRHAGSDGKRAVVAGWAQDRWGWGALLARPAALDAVVRDRRLLGVYDLLEAWLMGASGDFPVHERPVWGHPEGPGYSHALDPDQRGFAMEHFQVRAMLHELARAGDPATWAIPVLAQRWRDPWWWDLDLRDEARGQPPVTLAVRAQATGQHRLAQAVRNMTRT